MVMCCVHGCVFMKSFGDNLFCEGHRSAWRKYSAGLALTPAVPQELIQRELELFLYNRILQA